MVDENKLNKIGRKVVKPAPAKRAVARMSAPQVPPDLVDFKSSLFPDGYSLELAAKKFKHLIEGDAVDVSDPLYVDFVEYEQRVKAHADLLAGVKRRDGAEAVVPPAVARRGREFAPLRRSDENFMALHTQRAFLLMVGRARTTNFEPIIGGLNAAAMLRDIWLLTARDNPYADWILVAISSMFETVLAGLESNIAAVELRVSTLAKAGLNYSIESNPEAYKMPLTFVSPYAYLIPKVAARFDYFVRVAKTLNNIAELSNDELRNAIDSVQRPIRGLFARVQKYHKDLSQTNIIGITRADYAENADDNARLRVDAAAALLGDLPSQILNREEVPRHVKRIALPQQGGRELVQLNQSGEPAATSDHLSPAATVVSDAIGHSVTSVEVIVSKLL